MLPLPLERILRFKFNAIRSAVSDSFLDIEQVDVPIKLWRKGNPEIESKCRVVLAVDVIAFRPTIRIREDGIIEGLDNFREFDPSLFETFLGQPQVFFFISTRSLWRRLFCALCFSTPTTAFRSSLWRHLYCSCHPGERNRNDHRQALSTESIIRETV
jgi:hypothetical protein